MKTLGNFLVTPPPPKHLPYFQAIFDSPPPFIAMLKNDDPPSKSP